MSKEVRTVLEDTLIALGIVILLVSLILSFLWGGITAWPMIKLQVFLGLWISGGCCGFMMVHMSKSMEEAMNFDPGSAATHISKSYGVRYGTVLLVALICYLTGWVNMIAFALGLLMLKPALYLQLLVGLVRRGPQLDAPYEEEEADGHEIEEEKTPYDYDTYGDEYVEE